MNSRKKNKLERSGLRRIEILFEEEPAVVTYRVNRKPENKTSGFATVEDEERYKAYYRTLMDEVKRNSD